MKKADELKGRWNACTEQESLAASVQWACVLSANGPVFPAQAGSGIGGWWKWANPWLWPWSGSAGQETMQGKTGQTLAPLSWFHILCWAGLWCGFTPQGQQHQCSTLTFHYTATSQSHQRSPGLRQVLSWEDPSGSRAWIPVAISLQSSSRGECLQAGCHLPKGTNHQPPEWSRQDAHGGLTWSRKHKSVPSASYIIVFQYTRLLWICVRLNITVK